MERTGKWRKMLLIASVGLVACGMKLLADQTANVPIVFDAASETSVMTSMQNPQTGDAVSGSETSVFSGTGVTSAKPERIPVYICGHVVRPGVYQIEAGTFLYELADEAGGLCKEAAVDSINLVYCLTEPVAIYIPSEEEIQSGVSEGFVTASDYIRNPSDTGIWGEANTSGSRDSSDQSSEKININTATQTELETLPGIGAATASAIIEYRQTKGNFGSIEDIMNVAGIKEGRFEALRDFITV